MGDQSPLLLEHHFSSKLQLDGMADPHKHSECLAPLEVQPCEERGKGGVILSTHSQAARKLGTQQLISGKLAVASDPKNRHHTTVITLPGEMTTDKRVLVPDRDLSWDDYDEYDLPNYLRRQSYITAVRSLNQVALMADSGASTLRLIVEESPPPPSPPPLRSPQPSMRPRSRRIFGRKRNQKHGGCFQDEPCLYQDILERGLHSNNQNAEDDLLEDPVAGSHQPDQGNVAKSYHPAQVTWSQLPQVSETLQLISVEERKRQEAIFEIITSEHSYKHSLDILVCHFKGNMDLRNTMTKIDHHHLFSNIADIQAASKRFFEDLERRHHDNAVIQDISDIVQDHASHHFQPYITYCANKSFQQRALERLRVSNTAFKDVLEQIEMSPECRRQPMNSFLILPMQRVTRLPLLMDTICQKTSNQTAEYFTSIWALKAISKLVGECNERAKTMERTEQMYTIQKQMDFGKIKPFPLVSASRWLRKRGELTVCTDDLSMFWKAFSHKNYYLFLFNDVFILTCKKSEESFVVMDYATLENVEVELELEQSDRQSTSQIRTSGLAPYSLKLLMRTRRNSEGRAEQIVLAAKTQIERARWVTALQQHKPLDVCGNKEDLPQCMVTKTYMPREPDELGLQKADVVIILQRVEGWYHGQRIRDGERGWFPTSYATEITNRIAVHFNVQRMVRLHKETNV